MMLFFNETNYIRIWSSRGISRSGFNPKYSGGICWSLSRSENYIWAWSVPRSVFIRGFKPIFESGMRYDK